MTSVKVGFVRSGIELVAETESDWLAIREMVGKVVVGTSHRPPRTMEEIACEIAAMLSDVGTNCIDSRYRHMFDELLAERTEAASRYLAKGSLGHAPNVGDVDVAVAT